MACSPDALLQQARNDEESTPTPTPHVALPGNQAPSLTLSIRFACSDVSPEDICDQAPPHTSAGAQMTVR